jgi:hypothetical protein
MGNKWPNEENIKYEEHFTFPWKGFKNDLVRHGQAVSL